MAWSRRFQPKTSLPSYSDYLDEHPMADLHELDRKSSLAVAWNIVRVNSKSGWYGWRRAARWYTDRNVERFVTGSVTNDKIPELLKKLEKATCHL